MTIRCLKTTKGITEKDILEAAVGEIDETYKKPLELIHLKWTNLKKVAHYSKTKGFEDTFIDRKAAGGLRIWHRQPGSAMWLKDPLSGKYGAVLAKTKCNMEQLASMYYDGLWSIREVHIGEQVKAMADEIDKRLAKNRVVYYVDEPVRDKKGNVIDFTQKRHEETELEYHKKRRAGHFETVKVKELQSSIMSMEVITNIEKTSERLEGKEAAIAKKEADLAEKEAKLEKARILLSQKSDEVEVQKADVHPEYTKEQLEQLSPVSKLRSIARKEFQCEKEVAKMTKPELIDEILTLQAGVPEEVEEPEVITA